jgi:hypothetical protein
MSVMLFRTHLSAKLQRRGFTPRESNSFLNEHTLQYSPLMDELFCELISESPFGGIPIILQRNPTLVRLSARNRVVTRRQAGKQKRKARRAAGGTPGGRRHAKSRQGARTGLALLTKPSAAGLAYGKVLQQHQEGFVSGA